MCFAALRHPSPALPIVKAQSGTCTLSSLIDGGRERAEPVPVSHAGMWKSQSFVRNLFLLEKRKELKNLSLIK